MITTLLQIERDHWTRPVLSNRRGRPIRRGEPVRRTSVLIAKRADADAPVRTRWASLVEATNRRDTYRLVRLEINHWGDEVSREVVETLGPGGSS